MVKKGFLVLVLAAIAAGGIAAQEKYDGSKKNTIFFGPIAVGYERSIIPALSVGAEAGLNLFAIRSFDSSFRILPAFADAFVRWYPWKRVFFVNAGLGYQGSGMGDEAREGQTTGVFHIKPQLGWKIDIGEAWGWVFETRVGFGMSLGGSGGLISITVPILFGRTF